MTKGGAGRGAGQALGIGGGAQARRLGAERAAWQGCAGGRRRAALGGTGMAWARVGHVGGRLAGAGGRVGRGRGATCKRQGRAAGRAARPAGCALGALCLFLAQFDSVFFRSQIFGHCS